jgi:Pentapeptide repeats (8 copies)/NACHT domain
MNSWFPLRFALRDLQQETDSRELLKRRLDEVGVSIASWRALVSNHHALVVLDGFDEMSVKMDPETLTGNIRRLVRLYDEFPGCKVLITSRTRVFENARDQERLLERIGSPQTILIEPVPRRRRIEYLDEFASEIGARDQLVKLRKLYDPIGLAAKPLFLQMIKETLQELPMEDFNEIVLYETYIGKSLERKVVDLEDEDLAILPSRQKLLDNLIEILEQVAVQLHISGEGYAYLHDFRNFAGGQDPAQILWRISDVQAGEHRSQGAQDDATARVGVRSLLKFVAAPDPNRWPVAFFHRSMQEFFIARAIVRDLSMPESTSGAPRPLVASPLAPEIVSFAVGLMQEREDHPDPPSFDKKLLRLAKGAIREGGSGSIGGNALTLLYGLTRRTPRLDWSGLNLDYADLNGADLSGLSFAGSSMRYANLDNANLENADFSNADLTGVRFDETAQVDAVTISGSGDKIIAAYEDGTIREWTLQPAGGAVSATLVEDSGHRADRIVQLAWGDVVLLGNGWLAQYVHADGAWSERTRFRTKTEFRFPALREDMLTVLHEEANRPMHMLAIDPSSALVRRSVVAGGYGPCEQLGDLCSIVPDSDKGMLVLHAPPNADARRYRIPLSDISSLVARVDSGPTDVHIATGHRDGFLRLWRVSTGEAAGDLQPVWERRVHDGVVTSLAILGEDDPRIVSGGTDRAVCLTPIDSSGEAAAEDDGVKRLHLTVRCKGMKIDGLQGEHEQQLLRERLVLEEQADVATPDNSGRRTAV